MAKQSTSNDELGLLLPAPQDFSLDLGGPLFQRLRLVPRRIVVISLFAWLPLLVLSALEGRCLAGSAPLPFLLDIDVHVRFLVAMPLLIVAELVVQRRMRPLVQQFLERHLVPKSAMARFAAAIASASRLRNSLLAEVLLLTFVYVAVAISQRPSAFGTLTTWLATPSTRGLTLSLAGWWDLYMSVPIFLFLLFGWYLRFFIWARFLWQVSRIELSLIPTHPDRVGGLGFLTTTVAAFVPVAVAHGALAAGAIANNIFVFGGRLPQSKIEIAVIIMFMLCLVLGPLVVFAPQLREAKRTGLREYGRLAERYVREFDAKWLRGSAPADEMLLGSADIQSLADLGNSFEVVRTMSSTPVTKGLIFKVVVATLAPIVPLALTMISAEELLKKLFGILL